MARPVKGGWDFVKKGMVLQYKEDSLIAIVEILEDDSDEEMYSFDLRIIAANMDIGPFSVSTSKSNTGIYSGMSQFYEEPEYMPIPMGAKWPHIYDPIQLGISKFVWGD